MSYWIFRDHKGDALGVEEMETGMETGIIEAPNGVWIGEIRAAKDRYEYYKITETVEHPNPGEHTRVYQLMGTIHSITKDQYETYQEFGLFDE